MKITKLTTNQTLGVSNEAPFVFKNTSYIGGDTYDEKNWYWILINMYNFLSGSKIILFDNGCENILSEVQIIVIWLRHGPFTFML
jgi:hypothetical protein